MHPYTLVCMIICMYIPLYMYIYSYIGGILLAFESCTTSKTVTKNAYIQNTIVFHTVYLPFFFVNCYHGVINL